MGKRKYPWRELNPRIVAAVAEVGPAWRELEALFGISSATLEQHWRRHLAGTDEGKAALRRHTAGSSGGGTPSDFAQRILKLARKKPHTLFDLCDRLDATPAAVRAALNELELAGSGVAIAEDVVAASVTPPADPTVATIPWTGKVLRFCSLADTHFGSKYAAKAELDAIYAECEQRGIDTVFHSGDLVDGERVYRGQEYELELHGAEDQRDYAIECYPKVKGITTHIIAGNHDWSFHKTVGYDIVRAVSQERDDFEYYGPIGRTINLEYRARITKRVAVHLLHPRGGSSYARSYKLQKIAEGYAGGEKPDLVLVGHWHHQCYLFVRHIHMAQVPCLQWQTPFEKELGLQPVVGAYFWEIEFSKDGSVGRAKPELVTFYAPQDAAP